MQLVLSVKLAVISTDDVEMHKMWEAHLEGIDYKNRGKQSIEFPIMADPDGVASKKYGMLNEPVSTSKDIIPFSSQNAAYKLVLFCFICVKKHQRIYGYASIYCLA